MVLMACTSLKTGVLSSMFSNAIVIVFTLDRGGLPRSWTSIVSCTEIKQTHHRKIRMKSRIYNLSFNKSRKGSHWLQLLYGFP